MNTGALGKMYQPGEVIFHQGDPGDCMYVIQSGNVEALKEQPEGKAVRLCVMKAGDFFGEMALIEPEARSATVRALDEAWILTLDKKTFLRRVHADPSLAYHLLQTLSKRIRRLDAELDGFRKGASTAMPMPMTMVPKPGMERSRLGAS